MYFKNQLVVLFFFNISFCHVVVNDIAHGSRKCKICPPGWGVLQKCNKFNDTVCRKCEQGKTYSSVYSAKSPCWPCSRCGLGLYIAKYCSRTNDTFCDECINFIGNKKFARKNDFNVKCHYTTL